MALNPIQQNLVETNIPLVHGHLNLRVPTASTPTRDREYADLFQEGCIGLMTAAKAYRPARDGTFTSFALPRIRLAVHRALHEKFATVRIPENIRRAHRSNVDPKLRSYTNKPRPFGTVRSLGDADLLIDQPSKNPWDRPAADSESIPNRLTIAARIDTVIRLVVESVRIEFRRRHQNRPDRVALIDGIIRRRILIPDPEGRESLRSIGQPLDVAATQVLRYEQRMLDRIRDRLEHHVEFQTLLTLARKTEDGFQTELAPIAPVSIPMAECSTRIPDQNRPNKNGSSANQNNRPSDHDPESKPQNAHRTDPNGRPTSTHGLDVDFRSANPKANRRPPAKPEARKKTAAQTAAWEVFGDDH